MHFWMRVVTVIKSIFILGKRTMTTTNLSPREKDVLQLVCDGLSNREIGLSLHIAESTARGHVCTVIQKLNARNRTECAAVGVRQKLVA